MNKMFSINLITTKRCLIIGLSYKRIQAFYPEIEQELAKLDFEGLIIFDLVFTNGIGDDRLFSTEFHSHKFQFNTSKKLHGQYKKYFTIKSNSIIVKMPINLNNTVLTSSQRANFPQSLLEVE